jgi:hypothetical protein
VDWVPPMDRGVALGLSVNRHIPFRLATMHDETDLLSALPHSASSYDSLAQISPGTPSLTVGNIFAHKAFLPSEVFPVAMDRTFARDCPTELYENITCIHSSYRTL